MQQFLLKSTRKASNDSSLSYRDSHYLYACMADVLNVSIVVSARCLVMNIFYAKNSWINVYRLGDFGSPVL